jgi:hypothetical protein
MVNLTYQNRNKEKRVKKSLLQDNGRSVYAETNDQAFQQEQILYYYNYPNLDKP